MTLLSAPSLPFMQQVGLIAIEGVVTVAMLWLMKRWMPEIIGMLTRLTRTKSDYQCKCARCQAERIRKMGRLGAWRQRVRQRNRFEREGL